MGPSLNLITSHSFANCANEWGTRLSSPPADVRGTNISMAPRTTQPPPAPPNWSTEKTLSELRRRLDELQQFKNRKYTQVKDQHSEWVDLAATVLRHGFGQDSLQVRDFYFTGHATGDYDIHFTPQATKDQLNFEARVNWEERELKGRVRELELMLPEKEISGAYDA